MTHTSGVAYGDTSSQSDYEFMKEQVAALALASYTIRDCHVINYSGSGCNHQTAGRRRRDVVCGDLSQRSSATSEQFDGITGYEKSVRNLTWSYAAFLSAVRARTGQNVQG
jgi:hypothetical protein